jgi:hypothetical protein
MFAERDARIEQSDGCVAIATFAMHPFIAITAFFAWTLTWLASGVFCLLALFGQISPETMTNAGRVFIAIWLLGWVVMGGHHVRNAFLRAFSRLEVLADSVGISLTRNFPFGSTTRKYPWGTIDFISEYVQEGRPYGGVVLCASGRQITIDSRLPNQVAAAISSALEAARPVALTKKRGTRRNS